ncbi:conserved exported hypothetical protein [Rhodospirillaceae bacterium LM-1]|nr:conserved exported hypothetical protein [Rhodospirillaceae bacterium LM-1]
MIVRHLLFLTLLLFAAPVLAGPLEDAKRQGQVGERADGYLGAPPGTSGHGALINDINTKRRQAYGDIASRNGTSSDAVGVLTGQKLIDQSPPGSWIMDANGTWRRK